MNLVSDHFRQFMSVKFTAVQKARVKSMNHLHLTMMDLVLAGCAGVDFTLCESLKKFANKILKHRHVVQ